MAEEECIHGLTGRTCTICIYGPEPRASERPQTSSCRSCEAEIIWVETEKGKKMPIDADPSADGRFELSSDGKSVHCHPAGVAAQLRVLGRDLYSSHFETCPDSEGWRRSR